MNSKVLSSSILGIDAYIVEVECHITGSRLPKFVTVGLPEGAVKESKERVSAAIQNSGYKLPGKHITVNLAPADIRKEGSAFDLPIAIGLLSAIGEVSEDYINKILLMGELALDGSIRPIQGVLPIAICAKKNGIPGIIVPEENAKEASVVEGVKVAGASSLNEVVHILNGIIEKDAIKTDLKSYFKQHSSYSRDFSDVKGHRRWQFSDVLPLSHDWLRSLLFLNMIRSGFSSKKIMLTKLVSKGLKNKNIKFLGGHPLLAWSIELCKKIKLIDYFFVSTDSKKYAKIALKYKSPIPFLRPKKMSKKFSAKNFVDFEIFDLQNRENEI